MANSANRRSERLVTLFVVGFLALNYPLLSLFATDARLFGIPLLVVYLFSVWAAFIFLTWWIVGRPHNGTRRGKGH